MNNVVRVKGAQMDDNKRRVLDIGKWVFLFAVIMLLYFPIIVIIIQSVNKNVQEHFFSGSRSSGISGCLGTKI